MDSSLLNIKTRTWNVGRHISSIRLAWISHWLQILKTRIGVPSLSGFEPKISVRLCQGCGLRITIGPDYSVVACGRCNSETPWPKELIEMLGEEGEVRSDSSDDDSELPEYEF